MAQNIYIVKELQKALPFLVNSRLFEGLIIVAIVANCVVLIIADYEYVDSNGDLTSDSSVRNQIVVESEYLFTSVFTIECIMKILSFGIIGKNSYLADKWNWLDLLVVVSGSVF
jgi:hypothetical protein